MLPRLPPLHFYPLLTAALFPVTFFLTYFLAVFLGHTEFDWPYISDTSAHPPESCIFGQLVNVGALLTGITVYIRYKQVYEFYISHQIDNTSHRINDIGLILGWLGAFGISLVANFQETEVFSVHLTGAILAFGVGSIYLWSQTYASFILCSVTHGSCLKYIRVGLSAVSSVGFVLMMVTGDMANKEFHGDDPTKWYPDSGGWGLHVTSTITEWIIAFSFNSFLLSFVKEFKQVKLDSPRICVRLNEDHLLFNARESSILESSYHESVTSTEDIPAAINAWCR